MNAYARYHLQRRDTLMAAARKIKAAKHGAKPRDRALWTPGGYDTVRDCVAIARAHNRLALLHLNPGKYAMSQDDVAVIHDEAHHDTH